MKLRRDWGGSNFAACSRAFAVLPLSSVPDKTASRLRWLKLVGSVEPLCARLRVSQSCNFVPFVLSSFKCCWKPFLLQILPGKCAFLKITMVFQETGRGLVENQNRSLKTEKVLDGKLLEKRSSFKISCAKLNSRNH